MLAGVAAGVVVVVAAVAVAVTTRGGDGDDRPVPDGPNVVVIMTDDQTLASLSIMDGVQRLITEQGTTFSTSLVEFPNCCPSRATYLTGRYTHNHGVTDNRSPWGGVGKLDQRETLPVWLEEAGYDTIHIGKYLNEWGVDGDISPPPGWTSWYSLIDPTTYDYYGYSVSDDGERVTFGDAPEEYSTDVLAREAVAQIEDRAGDERPFFLSFTPLSPHVSAPEKAAAEPGQATTERVREFPMPVAPARYAATYLDGTLDHGPAFDEEDVADKPDFIRDRPRLSENSKDYIRRFEIAELGGVAAVDDAVEDIVEALEAAGELDDTLIIFTSDNGLFHGEHRIVTGKYLLYEPSVRVPLILRGPGVEAGAEVATPVGNIDLAPTILDATGVAPGGPMDGRSLLDVAAEPDGDRALLLHNYRRTESNSAGVRTSRWAYIEHADGQVELYDLEDDPGQLENLEGRPEVAEVQADLAAATQRLLACAEETCAVPVPESARAG